MQASDLPRLITEYFAKNVDPTYIRTVPLTTVTAGRASFDIGFPPPTFVQAAAGGLPPDGRDMNYMHQLETQIEQWAQAGGLYGYNSTLSTAIGGYPQGAVLQSTASSSVFWVSTVDNNTSNPDTGGANWISIGTTTTRNMVLSLDGKSSLSQLLISGDTGFGRNVAFGTNKVLRFSTGINTEAESGSNAGSNPLGIAYDDTGAILFQVWKIIRATGQFQILQSLLVPNLAANNNSGLAPNTIYVDRQALINNIGGLTATSSTGVTIGASFNQTASLTFTAPCKGVVYATGGLNVSNFSSNAIAADNITAVLKINGTTVGSDNTPTPQWHQGFLAVANGATVTVAITVTTTTMPSNAKGTFSCGAVFTPTL